METAWAPEEAFGFAAATSTSSAVIMSCACAGGGGGDGRVAYLEYTTACCRNGRTMKLLKGQGLLSGSCSQHTLNFESEVKSVPKDVSCWAHAVLRTVRELDIDKLEQALPLSNPSLGWMTLIAGLNKWRNFGDESIDSNTTIRFREHVTRQLLDARNEAKCHQFITGQLSNGDLGDMPAAMARAAELGLLYDVKNPVHKWQIAMLHPKTQFSDPVMLAILKLDFDGMLGVVTLSQITHKTFHTPELLRQPKEQHVYQFCTCDQRTVLPETIVAIGVLFESASPAPSLDDPAFGAILTKQAEDQVAPNRTHWPACRK
jgi:hypothetical protein